MPIIDPRSRFDPETGQWLIPPPRTAPHVSDSAPAFSRRTVLTSYDMTVFDESAPPVEPDESDTPPDAA